MEGFFHSFGIFRIYELLIEAAACNRMILVFGSLSMGAMAGAIGRKKTIMVFCLPLLVGWIIVGISGGNILLLYLGRIFQGIGTMSSVTQVYLVEVADAQRRQFSCFFFINKK